MAAPVYAYFSDLLDVLLPGRNRDLVLLNAYFDASARKPGTFCVAGYVFAKPQVKKFDRQWWALFGIYGGTHMKELAGGYGRFKGVDAPTRGALLIDAVQIIRQRISFGVAVSCDLNEINSLLPTWMQGFEHAYPVCCHIAMTALGMKVKDSGHSDDIAYFFEDGDDYSASAHKFMDRASHIPELRESYCYGSSTFICKRKALALQAADILAWEWAKYMDETVGRRNQPLRRPMRKSLAALVRDGNDYDSKHYQVSHITGIPLRRYLKSVTELGLMEIEERMAAKATQPSAA